MSLGVCVGVDSLSLSPKDRACMTLTRKPSNDMAHSASVCVCVRVTQACEV